MDGPLPHCEPADIELVESARRGDLRAFNALVARWERKVYNYLLRCTGNRDDALDLCQEAFLKAYRGLGGLAAADRFPSWLFRIAHNAMVSSRRRKRPDSNGEGLDRLPDLASLSRSRLGSFGYGGAELAFLVEEALTALPGPQREVVLLKLHHGFKFREIAEILDRPVSTVKSRLYAGIDKLRDLLEPVRTRSE